jgi:hypothetical protein
MQTYNDRFAKKAITVILDGCAQDRDLQHD